MKFIGPFPEFIEICDIGIAEVCIISYKINCIPTPFFRYLIYYCNRVCIGIGDLQQPGNLPSIHKTSFLSILAIK